MCIAAKQIYDIIAIFILSLAKAACKLMFLKLFEDSGWKCNSPFKAGAIMI